MGATCEPGVASQLSRDLGRCAETCEQILASYVADNPEAATTPFAAVVMLAVAGMQTACEAAADDESRREASLLIAGSLARDATATVRAYGLDDRVLSCADALDRAAFLCESAL